MILIRDSWQPMIRGRVCRQIFFHFFCWQGLVHYNSGHRSDRKVLFSVFVDVFYSNHSQTKTKKFVDKIFSIFSAGRVWYTITLVIGVIEKFCFQHSSSFSIAITARLKRQISSTKNVPFFSAGRVWYTITRVIGVKEKLCFGIRHRFL